MGKQAMQPTGYRPPAINVPWAGAPTAQGVAPRMGLGGMVPKQLEYANQLRNMGPTRMIGGGTQPLPGTTLQTPMGRVGMGPTRMIGGGTQPLPGTTLRTPGSQMSFGAGFNPFARR